MFKSRAAWKRSVFRPQMQRGSRKPSGAAQFKRIGAENGDSRFEEDSMLRLLSVALLVSVMAGAGPAKAQAPTTPAAGPMPPETAAAPPAAARPARPPAPVRDPLGPGMVKS